MSVNVRIRLTIKMAVVCLFKLRLVLGSKPFLAKLRAAFDVQK